MATKPVQELLPSLAVSLSRTRKRRLLVTILVPPVLGGEIMLMAEALKLTFKMGIWNSPSLGLSLTLALASYIFMGLQSLCSALVMEYWVRKRARHKLVIVIASSILGMLAGASVGLIGAITLFMSSGLLTGLIMGLILASTFEAGQY